MSEQRWTSAEEQLGRAEERIAELEAEIEAERQRYAALTESLEISDEELRSVQAAVKRVEWRYQDDLRLDDDGVLAALLEDTEHLIQGLTHAKQELEAERRKVERLEQTANTFANFQNSPKLATT